MNLEPVLTTQSMQVLDALGFDYYRTEFAYRRGLRSVIRGLWSGVTNIQEASAAMESSIARGLRQAFNDGITAYGLTFDDLTADEIRIRDDRIAQELGYTRQLLEAVFDGSKANGGKLQPFFDRVELWVARYAEMQSIGQLVAARGRRLEYIYDPTKEHCVDCLALNGRVYTARVWLKWGIWPRSSKLACFGIHCGCIFIETDKPVNKGRPPALRGPKHGRK
jgi:hypothetical protein